MNKRGDAMDESDDLRWWQEIGQMLAEDSGYQEWLDMLEHKTLAERNQEENIYELNR